MRKVSIAAVVVLVAGLAFSGSGCGGGGSSSGTPSVSTGDGIGKVQAKVYFPGRSSSRYADQNSESVKVTIAISGKYGDDGTEFTPVTSELVISLSQGYGSVSVLNVPIGTNHLLTAIAVWPDNYTQTIKCIIPSVAEGQTTAATANPRTTAIANAAIEYASANSTTLSALTAAIISMIGNAVDYFYGQTPDYTAITASNINAFMTPSSATISPTTATLNVNGTQQFTAVVYNTYEVMLSGYTWSTTGGIGTISSTGLFTATSGGSGVVTVTMGSVTASASVTALTTTSDTGCSDAALADVATARTYLFKSTITASDVASAEAEVNSALGASPNCPDANLLSSIIDLANEADRVGTNVLTNPESLFPLDAGYTVSESLGRVTTQVFKGLPRVANTLDDTSAPSEFQTEINTNTLGVLSGALSKLELVRDAIALDSTWVFSYPKDPDFPSLGNETLDGNDIEILTGVLKLAIGQLYYVLAYNLDPPANYASYDPCPELSYEGYVMVNGFYEPVFSTDTSTSALISDNTCPEADTDNDGILTPDEYLVPAPFGTLTTNGASYLDSAQTYISYALEILSTAIDSILAETSATVGGVPVATTLIADVQQYKHFIAELAASFGGTATDITYPVEKICIEADTFGYHSSTVFDPAYNTEELVGCEATFVSHAAFTANINFGAMFDVADFRDILPDMDYHGEVSSTFSGSTMGGLFPGGIQNSWFDWRAAEFFFRASGIIDSTTGSLVSSLPAAMTVTVDGIQISCSGSGSMNFNEIWCEKFPMSIPTEADFMTFNDMFGTTITFVIDGYQNKTMTIYGNDVWTSGIELTPTAL